MKDVLLQTEKIFIHYVSERLDVEAFTNRLFIRSYIDEDFNRCLDLYGNKEITKFFDDGNPRSHEETLKYVQERGRRYFDQGLPFGLFSVFLKEEGAFIGQVDLVPTDVPGEVEMGWILKKDFQRQKYCSEAVLGFLIPFVTRIRNMQFASNGIVINRVIATAHPENIASNRVIQKADLTFYQTQLRYGGNPRNWYCLNLNKSC